LRWRSDFFGRTLSAITARYVAFIGDENADCAPAFLRAERSAHVFKRRRFKQEAPLQDRAVEWAKDIRKQADVMRPSPERDQLLKKLRQAETAMHLEDGAPYAQQWS